MPDELPVSRREPAPGVYVDRVEKTISVHGKLELHGAEATSARAMSIQAAINTNWTHDFGKGVAIECKMNVIHRKPGTKKGHAGQIEAMKMAGPSYYSRIWGTITLNANSTHAFNWVAAHEFGHMIGLDDQYSESIKSKLSGKFGGGRTNAIEAGYENNIMGKHEGVFEKKNIQDLIDENKPGWMQLDNRVRDWVNAHNLNEIGQISTTNKLAMLDVLIAGTVTEPDSTAMNRICESVKTKEEAKKIVDHVKPNKIGHLGYRLLLKAALDDMPGVELVW